MRRKLLLLIAAFLVGQAQAATIEQPLVNVQQEQEARDIFHGLALHGMRRPIPCRVGCGAGRADAGACADDG